MSNLRTLVRIRVHDPTTDSHVVKTADVVAACKVAGYQFLVHRVDHDKSKFTATYAPVGLSGGGEHPTIERAIEALMALGDRTPKAIESALESMRREHFPLLSDESGIEVDDWKWREQSRLDSGEYLSVPSVNGLEYPKEHYLHLSNVKTETDFVAYTPSAEYGERDRQVRMKFGKYLRKVFPEMADTEVQAAVMALRSTLALSEQPATLLFATDRATINEIFETEMCACDSTYTSCMHGKFADQDVRPYHVYADSPDVAVAYVREHGEIVARTVVSTKDKHWVRTYAVGGDSTKCHVLADLLRAQGYSKGELNGNRLTKVGRGAMLPYIDNGGMGVIDQGKYWIVCDEDEGDYNACNTDGTGDEVGERCSSCECLERDCECYYCECCEERYPDGCDRCSMCPVCDGCTEHNACSCSRCSECGELLEVPRGYRGTPTCDCDRCSECNELDSDCECEHCDKCHELEVNCECEEDSSDESTDIAQNAAV